MNKQAQYGKGLSGFLSGLLLATAVIVGILFFLNKGSKQEFKELTRNEKPAEPEVLQPKEVPEPAETPKPAGRSASEEKIEAPEVLPSEKEASSETNGTVSEPETIVEENDAGSSPVIAPPVAKTDEERDAEARAARAAAEKREAERRIAEKRRAEAEKKRAAEKAAVAKKAAADQQKARSRQDKDKSSAKDTAKKSAKPTPEQILNSGSIESARQAASAESKKTAEKNAGGKAEGKKAAPSSASAGTGKKVVLQMGSYGNRAAADAQRAKLAMMGVQSTVVESSANGKNVYRIQSASMSQDAAKRIQQTLQKNGVSSFARSAQ